MYPFSGKFTAAGMSSKVLFLLLTFVIASYSHVSVIDCTGKEGQVLKSFLLLNYWKHPIKMQDIKVYAFQMRKWWCRWLPRNSGSAMRMVRLTLNWQLAAFSIIRNVIIHIHMKVHKWQGSLVTQSQVALKDHLNHIKGFLDIPWTNMYHLREYLPLKRIITLGHCPN